MFSCLIKVEVKPYKTDEFVKSMHAFSSAIRGQKGCLCFNLYQDSEKEEIYNIIGEWKTRKDMQRYFQTTEYQALIGATRILCDTFEMTLADVSQRGGRSLPEKRSLGNDVNVPEK